MIISLALLLLGSAHSCFALLEERFVGFEDSDGALNIADATIVYDAQDPKAVQIAVSSLSEDWGQITGTEAPLRRLASNDTIGSPGISRAIIAATVDSDLIGRLEERDKIDVSDIRGKWESFKTFVVSEPIEGVDDAFVIAGSDKRGTAFGVYTLSEQSGQSPLHFWADVPAAKHDAIYALPKTTRHGEPSVKYRGLFINDEAPALTGWWARTHNVSDYTFDTEFYAHVFDLLVRLKGNFMWPAMWASFIPKPGRIFFTDDPGNQQLADDYGIVVSTSHHEPMQRNSNEWDEDEDGAWNWVENRDSVEAFMDEGVRRAGRNESYFTMGMRGESDGPINADDPVAVLKEIIAAQRDIIAKYNDGNASAAPQVWTVYKEVQAYYEAGVVPPSDVTIMFADDNWGNIRRLPTTEELERSGGIGVYFHLGYVGTPKSWKWQNSNNFPKIYKELFQAYERGARQIWVLNVEDIKPLEVPFSFAMDLAWNASSIDLDSIPDWLEAFSAREFGTEAAEEAASVLLAYSHLVGLRKYEMTTEATYSVLNYREAERVLDAWTALASRARALHEGLAEDRRDALFHHIVYPVVAGALYNAIMINRGRNQQFVAERRNSANDLVETLLDDFGADFDLTVEYDTLAGGKWQGIMSTPKYDIGIDTWRPPSRDVLLNVSYVQTRQDFDYGFGNLGIYAQGSRSAWNQGRICASADPAFPTDGSFSPKLPLLTPYGPSFVVVDLFHRGDHRKDVVWSLDVPYDWLRFSSTSGALSGDQAEQRLNISVDWDAVPEGFDEAFAVRIDWEPAPYFDDLIVAVANQRVPDDFSGFAEVDGIISIEAPHFQRASEEDVAFQTMPRLASRSDSGSIALRPFGEAREDAEAARGAWVEYDIYLFGDKGGDLNVTLYVTGALDTDPDLPLMYSLTVDGGEGDLARLLEDPEAVGELPPDWEHHVADSVWIRTVGLGSVEAGQHTLRWSVNSPELYLEKLVVQFNKTAPSSYLGPPESQQI